MMMRSRRTAVLLCLLTLVLSPAGRDGLAAELSPGTDRPRFIVMFEAESGLPATFEQMVTSAGGSLVRAIPQVGMAIASGDAAFAARIERTPGVQRVAPDKELQSGPGGVETLLAPNPPVVPWNMRAIKADAAWAAGYRGNRSVKVAILDTGIDPTHTELAGVVDATRSASFIEDIPGLPQCFDHSLIATYFPGAPAWTDIDTHGTHVAGIVAAQGRVLSGVAPNVTLIAVKVVNVCNLVNPSWAIAGIVHAADQGADVINMSLQVAVPRSCRYEGQPRGEAADGCAAVLSALNRAVAYARSKGALLVAAAGNFATDFDHAKDLTVLPADLPGVMGVSATAPLYGANPDTPASYTNYGSSLVDVAGPGGRFAGGTDMVLSLCSNFSLLHPECLFRNSYQYRAGTSFSAPHVAGVAALVDSIYGGQLSGDELQSLITSTADDLGKPGKDPYFGRGRVNALRAVTEGRVSR
jgi:subtilisin family serine protease